MNRAPSINPGQIITGALFNEPMRVETVQPNGPASWVVGMVGKQSERFRRVTLTVEDLRGLTILDAQRTFDGDGRLLRLGLQAYALGIAYEFDPYFGLSISRVDPLPHQLEAVYDYLLKLARVRFLLADDAGAGKTIMAGLLIRELELRGLAERILIVCPAPKGGSRWRRHATPNCSPDASAAARISSANGRSPCRRSNASRVSSCCRTPSARRPRYAV